MQRRLPGAGLVLSLVTVAVNGDPSNGDKNVTGPSIMVSHDNQDIMVGPGTHSGKGWASARYAKQTRGQASGAARGWSGAPLCGALGPEDSKGPQLPVPPPPATAGAPRWGSGGGAADSPPTCCVCLGQASPSLGLGWYYLSEDSDHTTGTLHTNSHGGPRVRGGSAGHFQSAGTQSSLGMGNWPVAPSKNPAKDTGGIQFSGTIPVATYLPCIGFSFRFLLKRL